MLGRSQFPPRGSSRSAYAELMCRPKSSRPSLGQRGVAAGKDNLMVFGTASQAAAIASGGVLQAASFAGTGLAPGGMISVFGSNMTMDNQGQTASSTPLPTALQGTSVNIGGIDAPLYFSSNGQINAQLPVGLPAGLAQAYLRVNRNGQDFFTDSEGLTVVPASPGIFTLNSSGAGQGAILISNTTLVAGPAGAVAGFDAHPVERGQYVTIFCTGLGAVSNQPPTGAPAQVTPLSNVVVPAAVTIGGAPAMVSFAGLASGFVGLYQVNAQVPTSIAPGNAVPLVVSQNGLASNTVTIAVQ